MTRFTLDWSSTNIDGANTVTSSGETTGFDVSTPTNAGDAWFLAQFPDGTVALAAQTVSDPTVVSINFDEGVENLAFELFDVDARLTGAATGWDDKITIIALDADGNQVPVSFTDLAFHHSISGNVLDTNNNASGGIETSGAVDTVGVNIAGPIVSLQIIYDNDGGPEQSGVVGMSDMTFSTVELDGYVEGGSDDDLIDVSFVDDPDGDQINNSDAVLPGEAANDDIVIAGGGDDTVIAQGGSDTIFGGVGEDNLNGGGGADTIYGDNPTFDGVLDLSTLSAGDIVEQQFIESGVRVSSFDSDNQVMVFDADNPSGGDAELGVPGQGNILILSEDGDGSDPDDNEDGGTFIFEFIGPATVNSLGFVDVEEGAEIRFYDEDGSLLSEIDVPAGADNTLFTQAINISGVFRMEVTLTSEGGVTDLNYTITNSDTGNGDTISGGAGADIIFGQAGDDIITGGAGADTLFGGFGSDTFLGGNLNDIVTGGEDPDGTDIDILNLTGTGVDFIAYDVGDPEAGSVTFLNGDTMTFSEIENVVPCFTPGTAIATPKGEVAVENLQIGDRVLTRDNGIQTINWVGQKRIDFEQLKALPELRPILIKAGAIGDGQPERDMLVSPSHRMLIVSELAQLYFEQSEVLVAAKYMLNMEGVEVSNQPYVTYVHFICDNHEIVLADGAWSESFQPGDYTMKGFDAQQRDEIFIIFPELQTEEGLEGYRAARKTLTKHEAKILFKG